MCTATVVIVTYNSSDVLSACAQSMGHLDVAGGYEVIVVDNASHDDSVAVARACWPQATIITNTHNRGFAAAVNQGVAAGSGRIVVTLNPDTEVRPQWLAALCDTLDADDSIGVAGSTTYDPVRYELTHSGADFDPITFRTTHTHEPLTAICDMPYVTGAGMALRRRDWHILGGFDEGFFPAYFEDLDVCMRVRARGLRCVAVPEAQLLHHESTSTGKQSGAFYYYYHRNRWRMITNALHAGELAPGFVMREAELLCQTNVLDRSVALLVARMGLPSSQRGLPDAQTQATVLATGQMLGVLRGDAYADPAHWPVALQELLAIDPLHAQATSWLDNRLNAQETARLVYTMPQPSESITHSLVNAEDPLYQQLFGRGWKALLRTRVLGAQFVHYVDGLRYQINDLRNQINDLRDQMIVGMQQQATLMLRHMATADRMQIETVIRQALILADRTHR